MKTKKFDIFDLTDISDLPETCCKNIKINSLHPDTKKLLALFELKESMTINEAIVGLYRKYKLEKDRKWIHSTIYNLSRQGFVKILGKGHYKLISLEG